MRTAILVMAFWLAGCTGIPENVKPVVDFDLQRYLGKWYEIARLDHSFERGLSHVTATYTLREDGGVRVTNRGYSDKNHQWKEAEGKAYFVQGPDVGYLKVSFFGDPSTAPTSSSILTIRDISTPWSPDQTNPICGSWPEHPHWILLSPSGWWPGPLRWAMTRSS